MSTSQGSIVFAIEIEPGAGPSDPGGTIGRITIDSFTETFEMSLGLWSEADYRESWLHAFKILSERDHSTSCLMTSMTDPATGDFLMCWPLYRNGEVVHVQNSLILLDELESPFDVAEPWASVRPRETVNEDGQEISEWQTSMEALARFFEPAR